MRVLLLVQYIELQRHHARSTQLAGDGEHRRAGEQIEDRIRVPAEHIVIAHKSRPDRVFDHAGAMNSFPSMMRVERFCFELSGEIAPSLQQLRRQRIGQQCVAVDGQLLFLGLGNVVAKHW